MRLQEAHQLCDMAMAQMRLITARLLKGKEQPPELGRFPGQVVLPRLCFRPTNLQQQGEAGAGEENAVGCGRRGIGAMLASCSMPAPVLSYTSHTTHERLTPHLTAHLIPSTTCSQAAGWLRPAARALLPPRPLAERPLPAHVRQGAAAWLAAFACPLFSLGVNGWTHLGAVWAGLLGKAPTTPLPPCFLPLQPDGQDPART